MPGLANGGVAQALAGGGSVAGSSPSPTADNILAWLTAREFVHPVRAVDYYGLPFMESIRRLQFPKNIALALAGGTLPRIPTGYKLAQGGMATGGAPTVQTGDVNLKMVNIVDKNMALDAIRSSEGETLILNTIRRNKTSIQTIVR